MSKAPRAVAKGVWVVTAGTFPSNSYICASGAGEAVVIDAGLDGAAIEAALLELRLSVSAIFCTHGHFDHIGSAAYFQKKYSAPVFLHEADARMARTNNFLLMAIKRPERIEVPHLTLVQDGYTAKVGERFLSYRLAPGHTPGSCVLALDGHMFTGDTIYSKGIGLSKLPGERHDQLRESILSLWDHLDQVMVHPGHGPSASGSHIKASNKALQSFLTVKEADVDNVWDGSDVNVE